jgi:hypothetical protein
MCACALISWVSQIFLKRPAHVAPARATERHHQTLAAALLLLATSDAPPPEGPLVPLWRPRTAAARPSFPRPGGVRRARPKKDLDVA